MSTLHVLLPSIACASEYPALRAWLARGERLPDMPNARDTMLRELLRFAGGSLPAAALRHYAHADDAEAGAWLCADPAYVRSEATGARLMAWPIDDLITDEASQLADALRPLFADVGVPLVVDAPSAWCLRLFAGAATAEFMRPENALGVDMLECLPRGETGRVWRRLFNESQVALHAHPVNAQRAAAGKLPINALWFWGTGALPERVETSLACVASSDDVLRGLAKRAHVEVVDPAPSALDSPSREGDTLLDLGSMQTVETGQWLGHFQRCLHEHRFEAVVLTFGGGERFRLRHSHRLRFWRRA